MPSEIMARHASSVVALHLKRSTGLASTSERQRYGWRHGLGEVVRNERFVRKVIGFVMQHGARNAGCQSIFGKRNFRTMARIARLDVATGMRRK